MCECMHVCACGCTCVCLCVCSWGGREKQPPLSHTAATLPSLPAPPAKAASLGLVLSLALLQIMLLKRERFPAAASPLRLRVLTYLICHSKRCFSESPDVGLKQFVEADLQQSSLNNKLLLLEPELHLLKCYKGPCRFPDRLGICTLPGSLQSCHHLLSKMLAFNNVIKILFLT